MTDFKLDVDALTKKVPFVARGIAKEALNYINNLEDTHTHKTYLSEIAPLVIDALPLLEALLPAIHVPGFVSWIVSHDWVVDKNAAAANLNKLTAIGTQAAAIAPPTTK